MTEQQDVTCPFCGQEDFDLVGLKDHLNRHCDELDKIESVEEERERLKEEE